MDDTIPERMPAVAGDESGRPGNPVFAEPALWRMRAAAALHLNGERLAAAISPGLAFPRALSSLVNALPRGVATLVDIGSGGGGGTEFLRRSTGATTYAIEPSSTARCAAQQCFPELRVAAGSATSTGLASGCADVVTLCGVMSLVESAEPVFEEVTRLLKPTGALGVVDLFAAGADELRTGPNVFRSFEWWQEAMDRAGFTVVEVGCGVGSPLQEWVDIADQVEGWIRRNCRHRPAFEMWVDDRRHLARLMDADGVVAGCIVGIRGGN